MNLLASIIDTAFGGLKVIGWLVAIGLVCGIPLFIFYTIKEKWPTIGKVIFAVVVFTVAVWLFYGSVSSFIEAKNTNGGAYVSHEIGEVWHDESQLKREGIVNGSMLFFVGCLVACYSWHVLKTKEKQHSTRGSSIEYE